MLDQKERTKQRKKERKKEAFGRLIRVYIFLHWQLCVNVRFNITLESLQATISPYPYGINACRYRKHTDNIFGKPLSQCLVTHFHEYSQQSLQVTGQPYSAVIRLQLHRHSCAAGRSVQALTIKLSWRATQATRLEGQKPEVKQHRRLFTLAVKKLIL